MELPKFIEENKNKIIEIAKWSNEHDRESAIVQYKTGKIKIIFGENNIGLKVPNWFVKNTFHIHCLPEEIKNYNKNELHNYILRNIIYVLIRTGASEYDMTFTIKHKRVKNYVATLKNNVLYIREFSYHIFDKEFINNYYEVIENFVKTIVNNIKDINNIDEIDFSNIGVLTNNKNIINFTSIVNSTYLYTIEL
ncbi:hypothetical protein [Mycobacterium sp.]|uniref:hypothetical protein n=1 Tax=Mycobacterium sp. TaxID=1785 RepID=UPI0031D0D139